MRIGAADLLREEWFVDAVVLCPAVIGAVRTLLGPGQPWTLKSF